MKTLKTSSMLLAVLAAFVLTVGVAEAAKKVKPLKGSITKIEGANITLTDKTGTASTFATNDSTEVTVNGEKKTVADLAVGKKATVTLDAEGKTATLIAVGKVAPAASAPATNP